MNRQINILKNVPFNPTLGFLKTLTGGLLTLKVGRQGSTLVGNNGHRQTTKGKVLNEHTGREEKLKN